MYAVNYIYENSAFFASFQIIDLTVIKQLRDYLNNLNKVGARHIEFMVENWNVAKTAIHAPVLGDYFTYFANDNKGELVDANYKVKPKI